MCSVQYVSPSPTLLSTSNRLHRNKFSALNVVMNIHPSKRIISKKYLYFKYTSSVSKFTIPSLALKIRRAVTYRVPKIKCFCWEVFSFKQKFCESGIPRTSFSSRNTLSPIHGSYSKNLPRGLKIESSLPSSEYCNCHCSKGGTVTCNYQRWASLIFF